MQAYLNLLRINNPVPILIMLWPLFWIFFEKNVEKSSLKIFTIFVVGGFLSRTFGCIFNDIIDRKIDVLVKRTKNRSIASFLVPVEKALKLSAMALVLSFLLILMLNKFSLLLSFGVLCLVVAYPFCKKKFAIPQLILGCTFNYGILILYVTKYNTISINTLLMYLSCVLWTISYDTIYALADINYDKKIGVKSSAIFFGENIKGILNIMQLLMLFLLAIWGHRNNYNILYYISLAVCKILFYRQYMLWKTLNLKKCNRAFLSNNQIGIIIFIGIIAQ